MSAELTNIELRPGHESNPKPINLNRIYRIPSYVGCIVANQKCISGYFDGVLFLLTSQITALLQNNRITLNFAEFTENICEGMLF